MGPLSSRTILGSPPTCCCSQGSPELQEGKAPNAQVILEPQRVMFAITGLTKASHMTKCGRGLGKGLARKGT